MTTAWLSVWVRSKAGNTHPRGVWPRGSLPHAVCPDLVRSSQVQDPEGLQTLFLEMLFKSLSQSLVASKSRQEMIR